MTQKDFIIVLAWPEGMVIASGAWYDKFLSKKGKYRVGHSALILVNSETKKLHYMDFGRYHTPFGFGRVRDAETDPDVGIPFLAEIKDGEIRNIEKILKEAVYKKANHGEGALYASVLSKVNFNSAFKYAKQQQERGAIKYGPFIINGTNCSRFVASTIKKSNPGFIKKLRLKFQFCLTPSPKRNVSICNRNFYVAEGTDCIKIERNIIGGYFKSIERR